MLAFARDYQGVLATETMLIKDLNDDQDAVEEVADFLARLAPDVAYLSIPTRPPAEPWAQAPSEETINRAYQIVSEKVQRVEYLIGYEGNAFAFTGDVEEDLLSITSVHPMREDAVRDFLERADGDWDAIRRLVATGKLVEVEHGDHRFYLRKLNRHPQD
jgi:wyosine [tRNA(Phe)-imidazoG37] synthetase (radical SAM superfamily)